MSRLPVIVSFGGINPAGRSSLHHGYRRLVIEKIGVEEKNKTIEKKGKDLMVSWNEATETCKKNKECCLNMTRNGLYGKDVHLWTKEKDGTDPDKVADEIEERNGTRRFRVCAIPGKHGYNLQKGSGCWQETPSNNFWQTLGFEDEDPSCGQGYTEIARTTVNKDSPTWTFRNFKQFTNGLISGSSTYDENDLLHAFQNHESALPRNNEGILDMNKPISCKNIQHRYCATTIKSNST